MGGLLSTIYNVVVTPLIYVIELVFSLMYRLLGTPGLSLVAVSLVVNVLSTPLYMMADAAQQAERDRQASMERWVSHIKKHFKGDEQYMMLSTYYRECGYKQFYALSSSISLLLQVPIFMAAYRYLSGLTLLDGASFLGITNLGAPDALMTFAGAPINFLPILMTLLNCASTWVYTRDLGLRDKLQAYGLALLFLVLLYQSPAGLVLYWTCNQIFSLARNVVMKLIPASWREKKPLSALLGSRLERMRAAVAAPAGVSATPTFLLSASLLAVLTGVLVPSALLDASPAEFITASGVTSPLELVWYTAAVLGGFFVLWLGVYFFLSGERGKRSLAFVVCALALAAVMNYFAFAGKLGVINADLTYETTPSFELWMRVANILALIDVVLVVGVLWHRAHQLVNPLLGVLLAGVTALAVPNLAELHAATKDVAVSQAGTVQVVSAEDSEAGGEPETNAAQDDATHEASTPVPFDEEGNPLPIFKLSREGRNVVIIYLDRAIGAYVPYLVNEKPELASIFDGFTFYPNTISYGGKTVFGSPAVLGSYEYTPARINERDEELLADKHDEAERVTPMLFAQAGFDVVMTDVPISGYVFSTYDYSNFDTVPTAKVYHTVGNYTDWYVRVGSKRVSAGMGEQDEAVVDLSAAQAAARVRLERDLCYYGIFRTAPVSARESIYDQGNYLVPQASNAAAANEGCLDDVLARLVKQLDSEMLLHAPDNSLVGQILVGSSQAQDAYGDYAADEQVEWQDEDLDEGEEFEEPSSELSSDEQIIAQGFTTEHVIGNEFLHHYSVLAALPEITEVEEGDADHFIFFANNATHTPDLLLVPDYVPSTAIDNSLYANVESYTVDGRTLHLDSVYQQMHYQSNMAAWLRVGEWLEMLKEEGVYDNTRIILISDHGQNTGQLDDLINEDMPTNWTFDAMYFNPLFCVKDFDAHGELATDWTFMTNADCPLVALGGIVDNPVNPYTGNVLSDADKYAGEQLITPSGHWKVSEYQTGTVYDTSDHEWVSVHDNIYDRNNWRVVWDY